MKDKEKQITEMAKIMCGNDCEECAKESAEFYKQTLEEARNNKCLLKNCAKTLYEQGYRKIDKDSVVLSREEYKKGIIERESMRNQITELFNDREQARKETAEKILKDFKLWAREYQYKDTVIDENGERPMTSNEKLNYLYTYLCDKYKVEIKE